MDSKTTSEPIYKRWWFIAIIVVFGLILYGNYLIKQSYYAQAEEEHVAIISGINEVSSKIGQIENRYVKDGLVNYYDFSDSDLESYKYWINQQELNYDEYINWIIANHDYMKHTGKSDFAISEMLVELRSARDQLGEAKLQIGQLQNIRNSFS